MSLPIFDSAKHYKILNVQHPKQAVDLIYGVPNGPVSGYHKNNISKNQNWSVVTVGTNLFYIKNERTGTHAFAYALLEGVPLSGSTQGYTWLLIDDEPGVYRIATPDQKYVWVLDNSEDYFSVTLRPAADHKGKNAQWTFETV